MSGINKMRTCYVCGQDLTQYYKDDDKQQKDLHFMPQKFPEIKLWNGHSKEVCVPCYKAAHQCMLVYNQQKASQ